MIETNILVVGGGPAGSTVAKYLSLGKVDNILIQRNFNFKKPCGGGIRLDAFNEFSLDKNLIQKQVDNIVLVYKTQRINVDISKTPIAIVDRVMFDASLRNDAQAKGTTLYEANFVSVEIFDDYVISKIKKDDEYLFIKSKYIVAADGVNSKIRKQVNGDKVSSLLTHYTDLHTKQYESCEFHFGKEVAGQYYAWAFPHALGSNIGTVFDNQDSLNTLKENLNVEEQTKDLGYKIPHFKNNLFYKERVFFVGDSAEQVLPFTYEGIYYAMSSAKILSDVLIKEQMPHFYEKAWNAQYKKKFDTLAKLQKIFLYNNFMIIIMMRLYKNAYIQEQMIKLWLGNRDLDIDTAFFMKVIKKILKF